MRPLKWMQNDCTGVCWLLGSFKTLSALLSVQPRHCQVWNQKHQHINTQQNAYDLPNSQGVIPVLKYLITSKYELWLKAPSQAFERLLRIFACLIQNWWWGACQQWIKGVSMTTKSRLQALILILISSLNGNGLFLRQKEQLSNNATITDQEIKSSAISARAVRADMISWAVNASIAVQAIILRSLLHAGAGALLTAMFYLGVTIERGALCHENTNRLRWYDLTCWNCWE